RSLPHHFVPADGAGSMTATDISPGDVFNRWTVLRAVRAAKTEYECECICGTRAVVQRNHLRAGRSKSCGCYRKEVLSEKYSAKILGQKFGRLTVIGRAGSNKRHNALWKCKCECGNEITAT